MVMARELVTVARFDIPANAHIAQNALEDEGIRSVIQDGELVAMDYLLNLAVGGIKIQVWQEDAARAVAVLEGFARATRKAPGAGTDEPGSDGGTEVVESDAAAPSTDNARDRYARRAIRSTLFSVLVPPAAMYSAYLILMTTFSEGALTGPRRWGVWVAAFVTMVLMGVSPVWVVVVADLVTTGRLEE
jgi:hypothetical protein